MKGLTLVNYCHDFFACLLVCTAHHANIPVQPPWNHHGKNHGATMEHKSIWKTITLIEIHLIDKSEPIHQIEKCFKGSYVSILAIY